MARAQIMRAPHRLKTAQAREGSVAVFSVRTAILLLSQNSLLRHLACPVPREAFIYPPLEDHSGRLRGVTLSVIPPLCVLLMTAS